MAERAPVGTSPLVKAIMAEGLSHEEAERALQGVVGGIRALCRSERSAHLPNLGTFELGDWERKKPALLPRDGVMCLVSKRPAKFRPDPYAVGIRESHQPHVIGNVWKGKR